jgi:Co/Zn/Cd efflux system component
MSDCGCEIKRDSPPQRRVLSIALALNATMFVVGLVAGLTAQSTGLIADSLDMLADAVAYGIALAAFNRDLVFRARAATMSGRVLLTLGIGVLLDSVRRGCIRQCPREPRDDGCSEYLAPRKCNRSIPLGSYRKG